MGLKVVRSWEAVGEESRIRSYPKFHTPNPDKYYGNIFYFSKGVTVEEADRKIRKYLLGKLSKGRRIIPCRFSEEIALAVKNTIRIDPFSEGRERLDKVLEKHIYGEDYLSARTHFKSFFTYSTFLTDSQAKDEMFRESAEDLF